MKTTGTNPTKNTPEKPELIKDKPSSVPAAAGIGVLVGGQSGKKSVETDHAEEEAFWRANHPKQNFAQGRDYQEFHPAYRTGYEGYSEFGSTGQSFEETETKLRERYETEDGSPKLPWTVVRPATHAAWHRKAGRK
jgi:hypothetical protein